MYFGFCNLDRTAVTLWTDFLHEDSERVRVSEKGVRDSGFDAFDYQANHLTE